MMPKSGQKRILDQGVILRPFSEDLLSGAWDASHQIMDYAAADPGYAKIYDHWKASRVDQFKFFSTAELAYAKFATHARTRDANQAAMSGSGNTVPEQSPESR